MRVCVTPPPTSNNRPYPDMAAVTRWLMSHPNVVRMVQVRLERSPQRLYDDVSRFLRRGAVVVRVCLHAGRCCTCLRCWGGGLLPFVLRRTL